MTEPNQALGSHDRLQIVMALLVDEMVVIILGAKDRFKPNPSLGPWVPKPR